VSWRDFICDEAGGVDPFDSFQMNICPKEETAWIKDGILLATKLTGGIEFS